MLASTWWVSIESRRLSAVCDRKGSTLSERELKEGARESLLRTGFDSMSETEVGGLRTPCLRSEGIWLRNVVTRWELWI